MDIKKINSAKIESAITDFENNVDFELVPVIAEKSSYVEHIGWMISLILIIFFIGTIDLFFQNSWASKTWYYVAAPFVAVIIGIALDKSDWIDRFFISQRERTRQVHEKAQRVFFLKHLHELKKHNSLVLFISLMERKIVILPDPRMKLAGVSELQQKLITLIQTEFKKGRYEEGFLKAIAFLKSELAPHFPKKDKTTTNEVANKLIWWKD